MRKRFKRNAVCNSDNYPASRNAHLRMLDENHEKFSCMLSKGEITITPSETPSKPIEPRFYIVKVWGKETKVSPADYHNYYEPAGFIAL